VTHDCQEEILPSLPENSAEKTKGRFLRFHHCAMPHYCPILCGMLISQGISSFIDEKVSEAKPNEGDGEKNGKSVHYCLSMKRRWVMNEQL